MSAKEMKRGAETGAERSADCVDFSQALVDAWRAHPIACRLPLLVNTQGWVRGLGLDMLVDTLRAARPTCVAQACEGEKIQQERRHKRCFSEARHGAGELVGPGLTCLSEVGGGPSVAVSAAQVLSGVSKRNLPLGAFWETGTETNHPGNHTPLPAPTRPHAPTSTALPATAPAPDPRQS